MIEGWITQLRKGLLEYCVLLVLRRGENYGYEIVQALKRMEDLAVSETTVYPILARLRDERIGLWDALAAETRAQTALRDTADYREGFAAFQQKRRPVFRGR